MNRHLMSFRVLTVAAFLALLPSGKMGLATDQPQLGQRFSRNMVSAETDMPQVFDPETGDHVKWSVHLGRGNYATPMVASGRVLIGTNNEQRPDPRQKGDRGVLLCLDEQDGSVLWHLVVPKRGGDPYSDWRNIGIVSTPTVEDDRVYVVSNRGEVLCLDLLGQQNGNDGPFVDEGRFTAGDDETLMEVTEGDADIIWRFDTHTELGTWPHDTAHASILLYGDHLYLNTSNGVDNTHRHIPRPDGPSLMVLDKRTGRLLAHDGERIGPRVFHCCWSSPALAQIGEQTVIFYGGGDGAVYAFRALEPDVRLDNGKPRTLECLWKFDCDPDSPKEDIHKYVGNRREGPSNINTMPVVVGGRLYVTAGGDFQWGKRASWLICLDVGQPRQSPKKLWSYPMTGSCCSTPAVSEDMVFVADCRKMVHCVDIESGQAHWIHELDGPIWSSVMVADGKAYIGSMRGDFLVMAAKAQKEILHSAEFESSVAGTPVAANGVLLVPTKETLYAIANTK